MIAVVFSFRIVDAGYKGVSESVAGVEFVGDRGIRLFVITRVYLKLNISYLLLLHFLLPICPTFQTFGNNRGGHRACTSMRALRGGHRACTSIRALRVAPMA